jgi:hypothetical protein
MKTVLWRNRTLLPILMTVGVTLCAAPLTDAVGRGGGGNFQRGGYGGGGGGGGFHGGGPHGGNPQVNNVHADARTNNVRNTSVNNVNNVNVNRNVNVNVNGNYHGGWDDDYHPVATAAAVTATVAVTAAVVGSMVRTVPANCVPVNYGGMVYQQCGTTWYQPQGAQYVVVRAPY